MQTDGGDCEAVLFRFVRAGIDLATQVPEIIGAERNSRFTGSIH
jgi:hypothetical protein